MPTTNSRLGRKCCCAVCTLIRTNYHCDCCLACNGPYYETYTLTVTQGDPDCDYMGFEPYFGTFTLRKAPGCCIWITDERISEVCPFGYDDRPLWILYWNGSTQKWALTFGFCGDNTGDIRYWTCRHYGHPSYFTGFELTCPENNSTTFMDSVGGTLEGGQAGVFDMSSFVCNAGGEFLSFGGTVCSYIAALTPIGDSVSCGCTCKECKCPGNIFRVSTLGTCDDDLTCFDYMYLVSSNTWETGDVPFTLSSGTDGTVKFRIACVDGDWAASILSCSAGVNPAGTSTDAVVTAIECGEGAYRGISAFTVRLSLIVDAAITIFNPTGLTFVYALVYCYVPCCSGATELSIDVGSGGVYDDYDPFTDINDSIDWGVFGIPNPSPPPITTVALPATSTTLGSITNHPIDFQISGPSEAQIRKSGIDFGFIGYFPTGENILFDPVGGSPFIIEFDPQYDSERICSVYFRMSTNVAGTNEARVQVWDSNGGTDTFTGNIVTTGDLTLAPLVRAFSPSPYGIVKVQVEFTDDSPLAIGLVGICCVPKPYSILAGDFSPELRGLYEWGGRPMTDLGSDVSEQHLALGEYF